jgi:outer membrane protein assembly factor BamB
VVSFCSLVGSAGAADWPQWRGPERNDVSAETGLLKTWPTSGPPVLWTYSNAGVGYSGPAIVGSRLYVMGARGETEYVIAIEDHKGQQVWATKLGPRLSNGWGDGPRGTPTVDGDVLYAIGGRGDLACLEIANGKKRWQVNLQRELGGNIPNWGYTESPLIDGDHLICTPGGSKGTLAALNKRTGKVVWRSTRLTDPAAYSSCIVADVNGVRQYLQMTARGVVGVAAKNGRLLWQSSLGANGVAVIPTPIFHNNSVYVTSGYGSGCGRLKLSSDGKGGTKAEQAYANKNMVNHHGGVVLIDEHLYGYSDSRGWVCQDFDSGNVVWDIRKLGKGSVTYADGHLYCYTEDSGTVVLLAATTAGFKEDGRFKIPRETTVPRQRGHIWTHPVVANGRLYLRDQDLLYCFDIRDRVRSAE